MKVKIQNNENNPNFPVLQVGVSGDKDVSNQELIFEIVKYKAVRTVLCDCNKKEYHRDVPTLNILAFANMFMSEKFNYREVVNGKPDSKITANNINDYKNKSVLINGSKHASALFVDKDGKVYSFDTYGTHQNTKFNTGTGQCDYKGGGSMEIFVPVGKDSIVNSVIAIQADNRLQGESKACAIWTICALLEVGKYDNIKDALDLESIDEKELTCKFKPHVLNNIIKLVSCIECGTYEEFDKFIKLEQGVDIDYIIPEKSKLISDETKKSVSEYNEIQKLKSSVPPIMSQSTVEDVPTRSQSAPIYKIYSEPSGTTPLRSSTPLPQKSRGFIDCSSK